MRVSELSRASGISVPTIKYYLREGLLPTGRATARNQADYGDPHLHRLRLIRVLVDVGGLDLASVRAVLDAIADESLSVHELLGVSHHALGPPPVDDDVQEAREEVDAFLRGIGWRVSAEAPSRRKLADALVALRRLGRDVDTSVFEPYAQLADQLAARELGSLPPDEQATRAELVERAVVGTVVFEAALVALRKLAQEHHSALRFGVPAPGRDGRRRPRS